MLKLVKKIKSLDRKSVVLIKNVIWAVGVKGFSAIVSLYTTPSYIRFFNNNVVLGLWFTSISLINMIQWFDIGIGNGLRNILVKPLINKDFRCIRENLSSGYIILAFIVLLIGIPLFLIACFADWNQFFGISAGVLPLSTLRFLIMMHILGILMHMILKTISSVLYAMQKTAVNSIILLFSSILILLYTMYMKTGNIVYDLKALTAAYVLSTNLPWILVTIYLFFTRLRGAFPSFRYFSSAAAKNILSLGLKFLWVQGILTMIFGINETLIFWLTTPEDVVVFQIYNKLFALVSTLFNLALTPAWSAVTDAIVKKDIIWIRKLRRNLNIGLLIFSVYGILIVLGLQFIVDFWLKDTAITVNYLYAFLFLFQSLIGIKMGIESTFIYGIGDLRVHGILLTICFIAKLFLSVVLAKLFSGWIFIVVATIIALTPTVFWQTRDTSNKLHTLEYINSCSNEHLAG